MFGLIKTTVLDLVFVWLSLKKHVIANVFYFNALKKVSALACVAQWIECQPANQRVASSIPSLGHMPGLQARSLVGGA